MTALLPHARRTSRLLVRGGVAGGAVLSRRPPGRSARSRPRPRSARARHAPRGVGHRAAAPAAQGSGVATARSSWLRRRGRRRDRARAARGRGVERGVLLASAAHFGEGELACCGTRGPSVLRLLTSAATTVGLPAAVGLANRRPAEVGVNAALEAPARRGRPRVWQLLRAGGPPWRPPLALAVAGTARAGAARGPRGGAGHRAADGPGPGRSAVGGLRHVLRWLARAAAHRPRRRRPRRRRLAAAAAVAARSGR